MAGAGYKLFNTGDVLTAQQVNEYLMQQTVMVFANAAARTTALSGILAEGLVSYLKDTDVVEIYTGAAWVSLDDPNAIQNSLLTTTGDIIYASAANTPARRAIGSTGDVLTVSGGLPTWSAPVTGSMTLISTTSLSGASTTISSIPSTYNHLFLMFTNFRPATDGSILRVAMNGASQSENGVNMISSSSSTTSQAGADIIRLTEGVGSGTQQKTAWLYILDYSATTDKGYFGGSAYLNTGNTSNVGFFVGGATRASTSAISSLVISFSAGNITSGSVKLYGVK